MNPSNDLLCILFHCVFTRIKANNLPQQATAFVNAGTVFLLSSAPHKG